MDLKLNGKSVVVTGGASVAAFKDDLWSVVKAQSAYATSEAQK